jgi:hypothetical protein
MSAVINAELILHARKQRDVPQLVIKSTSKQPSGRLLFATDVFSENNPIPHTNAIAAIVYFIFFIFLNFILLLKKYFFVSKVRFIIWFFGVVVLRLAPAGANNSWILCNWNT